MNDLHVTLSVFLSDTYIYDSFVCMSYYYFVQCLFNILVIMY